MLEKTIHNYLQRYIRSPFLLALSGGPDSMALFYLLLQEKVFFHVAHVNHNWRAESQAEENILAQLCKEKNIPFHSKKLFPQNKGNLEDQCRNERYLFFKKLVDDFSLQGVMLAHHVDDQAETVLKRVLEGATLSKLKGLNAYTKAEKMPLFRPFINVKKKEIMKWLEAKNISYFVDSTNFDPHFLRARLRKEIFPLLSSQFGKEVTASLVRLAHYSEELHEYLEHLLEPYRAQMMCEEGRWALDLSQATINTPFEWKAVIKDFFQKSRVNISHSTLETVLFHLPKTQEKEIIIGQNRVVIVKKTITIFPKESQSII